MTDASLRKGWCPGARRPMAARDGLVVRLRITGGILAAAIARALADLATACGNGLLDLSARGNLQIRGVSVTSLAVLQDGLRALDLLDENEGAESVRNVMTSPLAGLHDGLDTRPLVRQLEARLTGDTELYALPGKFGFVIDDGGPPSLASIDADVRFDWLAAEGRFSIGLAGSRGEAVRIGSCEAHDLVERAGSIARGALALLAPRTDARRMRHAVAAFGTEAVTRVCGGRPAPAISSAVETRARDIVGWRSRAGAMEIACLGLAAPFGRLDAGMLRDAAALATQTPFGELRLTPWRTILVPGATDPARDIDGFITDPFDPRLAVAACVGAEGCARASASTHADAARLAASLAAVKDADITLHVSGCPKGCAKPSASPIALVARDGRYDLIRDGRADAAPSRFALDLAAARDALLELA